MSGSVTEMDGEETPTNLELDVDPHLVPYWQIYLYSFCIIFIVVILNVFIFIIETGYEKAQRSTGSHDERPLMLDHDRLHRVLDAAEKAVARDNDELADEFSSTDFAGSPKTNDEPDDSGSGASGSLDDGLGLLTQSRADAIDDMDVFRDSSGANLAASGATEQSVRIDQIIRAAVEDCTRKVLSTQRELGGGGVGAARVNPMANAGTDALLDENDTLRNEVTASEKVIVLLKRDLQTLTAAVTNLRRAQSGHAMEHWSTLQG